VTGVLGETYLRNAVKCRPFAGHLQVLKCWEMEDDVQPALYISNARPIKHQAGEAS
jgi:hypothetical protein